METFLGIDLGTQQLKAVLTDENLNIVCIEVINYDNELPEFNTVGGVHRAGETVTAPVLMWIKALDNVLYRLKLNGIEFSSIKAISGAAQQHGSVFWKHGAEQILKALNFRETLFNQLQNSFATNDCPIWMDASTTSECKILEDSCGGPMQLATRTGSVGCERFTGPQIFKKYRKERHIYDSTEHVSLISSFLCSVFCGCYASVDFGDASGTNLFNIATFKWDDHCVNVCGKDLRSKLADCVPSTTSIGFIADYFVKRYGFSPACNVIVFTGDNPCKFNFIEIVDAFFLKSCFINCRLASLAVLCQSSDCLGISLGTSDTLFFWLHKPVPIPNGHVFCNPLKQDAYMGLICFRNGDGTRTNIRALCGCKTWYEFELLVAETPPGNDGFIGIYFDELETSCAIKPGYYRFNVDGKLLQSFAPNVEARAILEHQCLSKRVSLENVCLTDEMKHIQVTGGASENSALVQILSDVFNLPVYKIKTAHSAALGGCARAIMSESKNFNFNFHSGNYAELVALPRPFAVEIYNTMICRYKELIKLFTVDQP
ncbi:Xylulose kinase [Trichinella pseudospiralis]|uniref:Xylulose kinase n=1 Tax=Trichinella pseudospiralis TaxID=6337 RepID=A0A0V1JX35_TRIPS|nr:Xylulose kinase [Trichinella pseudospiralis]